MKHKVMKTNVILTYNGLSDGLLARNAGDHQKVMNVSCVVKSTDTEQQVWDKIVRQTARNMDADYIPYVCKISTASNWQVWEDISGKTFGTDFDGKFFFARDNMDTREKQYEAEYGFGTAEDCWVEPPSPEEAEYLAQFSLVAQLTHMLRNKEAGRATASELEACEIVQQAGGVKAMVDMLSAQYGSCLKALEHYNKSKDVHGNA